MNWEVQQHAALSVGVRASLLAQYGYTAPALHTYGAIVSIIDGDGTCLVTFPFTFIVADYTARTGDLEAAIAAECRARLLALRNAEPLTTIVGRRHPL